MSTAFSLYPLGCSDYSTAMNTRANTDIQKLGLMVRVFLFHITTPAALSLGTTDLSIAGIPYSVKKSANIAARVHGAEAGEGAGDGERRS